MHSITCGFDYKYMMSVVNNTNCDIAWLCTWSLKLHMYYNILHKLHVMRSVAQLNMFNDDITQSILYR